MSKETQTMTAEATAQAATASGSETTATAPASAPLSTASGQWALKAAALGANEDVYVQCSDPQFTGQTKRVTFGEPVADEEEGEVTVRLPFEINEEIATDTGLVKAPGHKVNPFPRVLKPRNDAKQKDIQRSDMDRATVGRMLEELGLLPKAGGHKLSAIYAALGQLQGKQALCAFSTVKGAKRDESGQFKTFQNFKFAAVNGSSNGSVGVSAAPAGGGTDY